MNRSSNSRKNRLEWERIVCGKIRLVLKMSDDESMTAKSISTQICNCDIKYAVSSAEVGSMIRRMDDVVGVALGSRAKNYHLV